MIFWGLEARISLFIRPEYLKQIKKNQGTSLDKMGKHFSKKSESQEFRNFGNLSLPIFEFLKLRIPVFWWLKMMNSWKWWKVEDEESLVINFPLIKCTKAWIWIYFRLKNMKHFSQKRNNFSIFGRGNPYHQSPIREAHRPT